ncbi:MAG: dihydroorotase [Prevotellaceae bacterium]|jgi:dihydroorotase|nr:dihydroorotase [Prevotellaceae bacterium]
MQNTYYIYNATIINEGLSIQGSLFVVGGRIEGLYPVASAIPAGCRVIDATGKWALPGVIDTHVHFREPGAGYKADIRSETRAAAAGGVTSFIDMPNTTPPATTNAAVDDKYRRASGRSIINYAFYIGATCDNLAEIRRIDTGRIAGVKLFLGSSTGALLVNDDYALSALFSESPVPIVAHCEDEAILQRNLSAFRMKYGDTLPASCHPLIRSEEACLRSTERVMTLADRYRARLHVLHLSTGREAALFTGRGSITAEACIPHLLFCDDAYDRLQHLIKCNPAIKTAADRDALRKAVAEGRITTVASDHAPHTFDEKQQPYLAAPSGMPSIQYALPLMIDLSKNGVWTPETVVERMCHAPARLFGIVRRGFLRPGFYADIVLLDPAGRQTIANAAVLSKCGWTPYAGMTVAATVTHTFVNGQLVFANGQIQEENSGEELKVENIDVRT